MLSLLALSPLLELVRGPVFEIIDKLIPDPSLKAQLKAQIESKTLEHQNELISARQSILALELASESKLTRYWRPLLMYLVMLLLSIYGLFIPLIELVLGHEILFAPRWSDIPDPMWNLLTLGVAGYIGGRSVEKLADTIAPGPRKASSGLLKRLFGFVTN